MSNLDTVPPRSTELTAPHLPHLCSYWGPSSAGEPYAAKRGGPCSRDGHCSTARHCSGWSLVATPPLSGSTNPTTNWTPPGWAAHRWQWCRKQNIVRRGCKLNCCGSGQAIRGVHHCDCVHLTGGSDSVKPLPSQPFHVLLELQEQRCRDLGDYATYKVTPCQTHQVTPGKLKLGKATP